ncbi:MAG: thiamine-phosphate kinase [Gemmatimonadota bacterium]
MVIRLGPGYEFDLIRRFLEDMPPLPDVVQVGPGDDAAVLRDGTVVSVDMSVEDIHFRRAWLKPEDIGYRAAAAALSDLAAMAAQPVAALAATAFAPQDVPDFAGRVVRGLRQAVEDVGAVLVGGDVTASPGPVVLDITVLGRAEGPVLRSGVRAGDEIWVTGELGGAATAVVALATGEVPPPAAAQAFRHPVPRIAEARWLAEHVDLHALIDLSDGLSGDAGHLAAASGVGITLRSADVPVHPDLAAGGDERRRIKGALAGGEDYELCLAAAPGAVEAVRDAFVERFGLPLTRVGTAQAGAGVTILDAQGEAMKFGTFGSAAVSAQGQEGDLDAFDHFRKSGGPG